MFAVHYQYITILKSVFTMTLNNKNAVVVELYKLPFAKDKDGRFGQVVTHRSIDEDDLVRIAVTRRTDLNATSLKAAMHILKEIAAEELLNGSSVSFGLGFFRLGVKGTFMGDNAQWDKTKNSLELHYKPTPRLFELVKEIEVQVRGMASTGPVINTVIDLITGRQNELLTPGGGVELKGSKMLIVGNDPEVGISLQHIETGQSIKIAKAQIILNQRSKILFLLPEDLSQGSYLLKLTTSHSQGKTQTNSPRSFVFETTLQVESL